MAGHPLTGQDPSGRQGRGAPALARTSFVKAFASPSLSHRELEISHRGSLYTVGTYEHCASGLLLFGGAGFPAHPFRGHMQPGSFKVLGTNEEAVDRGQEAQGECTPGAGHTVLRGEGRELGPVLQI